MFDTLSPTAIMLLSPFQVPPPQPPAIVQEGQIVKQSPHGSEIGPPVSLAMNPKIGLKIISPYTYTAVVVIEGKVETLDKLLITSQFGLPWIRTVLSRPEKNVKYARMTPFWMNASGTWHKKIPGNYSIGLGY
ncbi:MAG: hypothetical protein LBH03_02350 [Holophagales bacterium]|jgi:hypothetical protein|nr:hypothetical protein [Holophagales bacterium]